MSTNHIALRSIEEFMSGYTPVYQPIYPLFLGKSQAYSEQAGKIDFKRVSTVGDIRAKHITPKDTEIQQIAATEASSTRRRLVKRSRAKSRALGKFSCGIIQSPSLRRAPFRHRRGGAAGDRPPDRQGYVGAAGRRQDRRRP